MTSGICKGEYCREWRTDLDAEGICSQCAKEYAIGYWTATKGGRCANGFERDHGVKIHAIRIGEHKAICGTTPQGRSYGWSSFGRGLPVTCPRCLARLTIRARTGEQFPHSETKDQGETK